MDRLFGGVNARGQLPEAGPDWTVSPHEPDIPMDEEAVYQCHGAASQYKETISLYDGTVPHIKKWLSHVMEPFPHALKVIPHATEPFQHIMEAFPT